MSGLASSSERRPVQDSRFLLIVFFVAVAMIAPLWAMLAFKWPRPSDIIFYANILDLFSDQFWSGDIYPRWLVNANDGSGSPVFLFYGPLSFYVGSAFAWLEPADPYGFARLGCSMACALFIGGISCCHWLKLHMPARQAQTGALLYTAFPYLVLPIYYTFGVAQLWAYAFFPLLLAASDGMARKGWKSLPLLSLSYALICLAHLPSLIIFGWIPPVYVFLFSGKSSRLKYFIIALMAAALAAALSAFYWLPALLNKLLVMQEHFIEGKFHYSVNFFNIPALLGMLTLLVPVLGFLIEMPDRKAAIHSAKIWLGFLAALLFLALPLSKVMWDNLTFMHYLQFPYRMILGAIPFAVIIIASWLPYIKRPRPYLWAAAAFMALFIYSSWNDVFVPPNDEIEQKLISKTITPLEYQMRGEHEISPQPAGFAGIHTGMIISFTAVGLWLVLLLFSRRLPVEKRPVLQ